MYLYHQEKNITRKLDNKKQGVKTIGMEEFINMGQTMTQKILAKASGKTRAEVGDIVIPKIGMLSFPDGNAWIDYFNENNLKVWDPNRVIFSFDHIFQIDYLPHSAKEHPKIRDFAKRQGIPPENIYDFGRNGISHQIPVEQGWALPGTVSLGLDTQSAAMGAANCFSMALMHRVEPPLLTGDVWLQVPECVNIKLHGKLPKGITGKDISYRLMKDLSGCVTGKVIEFSGPGVSNLAIDVRMAIANVSVQLGALTMIFPPDQVLLDYLDGRAREPFKVVEPDVDAKYVETYDLDLSTIEHLVAGPNNIEIIRPLSELEGLEITAANIGSCSSGRVTDLALAAEVLRGNKVHPNVRLIITPISAATMREATEQGIINDLVEAGATITTPGCGACYVGNLSPLKLGDGERCISTSVETVPGRMGSMTAEILLGNSAVAAASAIEGRITDPMKYLIQKQEV